MQHRAIRLACIIAAVVVGGQGCHGATEPTKATGLSIYGAFALSAIGQTGQLVARLALPDLTTKNVTTDAQWTSADPSIATVSAGGLVTAAGGLGTVNIVASYQTFTATKAVNVVLVVKSLQVTGNVSFTQIGQTSQLTATVTLPDGSTRDATSFATWRSSDTSIATVSSQGLLSAVGLGVTSVSAGYGAGPDQRGQTLKATVTPAGTFVVQGRVRHPGHGGVPFIHVVDTQSGLSTVANSGGYYTLVGLAASAQLAFDLAGFEPAQLVVTGNPGDAVNGDMAVQRLIRIPAGETGQTTIAPNDLEYDVSPTARCVSCRLIRVVSPGSGTLHVAFTWNKPGVSLTAWIAAQPFPGTAAGPLAVDVRVVVGEVVLYVGVASGAIAEGDILTLSVTTSFTAN